jgi:hypothetical protein
MSSDKTPRSDFVVTDRRAGDSRRGGDRRQRQIPVALERRKGRDRRQQGERRRNVNPTTCERDYTEDEVLFMKAIDQYKRDNRRPFPTWSEVLEVLYALGYRKVADPQPLPGYAASLVPRKG